MSGEEIDAFLSGVRLCHFATIDDQGLPRIRPLWYLWRDGAFLLTTRREVRHTGRDLGEHPQIALSVASEDRPYRAVVAHGVPEILPKDRDLLLALSTRYGDEPGRRWTQIAMAEPDRVLMRLEPERLISWDYGKSS
jgi:PPOX class probable F420-dependent enzyme